MSADLDIVEELRLEVNALHAMMADQSKQLSRLQEMMAAAMKPARHATSPPAGPDSGGTAASDMGTRETGRVSLDGMRRVQSRRMRHSPPGSKAALPVDSSGLDSPGTGQSPGMSPRLTSPLSTRDVFGFPAARVLSHELNPPSSNARRATAETAPLLTRQSTVPPLRKPEGVTFKDDSLNFDGIAKVESVAFGTPSHGPEPDPQVEGLMRRASELLAMTPKQRSNAHKQQSYLGALVVDGDSNLMFTMDLLYILTTFTSSLLAVYLFLLERSLEEHPDMITFSILQWVFTVVFMITKFFCMSRDGMNLVDTQPEVRHRYMRSWFVLDLLVAMPFEFVGLLAPHSPGRVYNALYCKHLFRVPRSVSLMTSPHPLEGIRILHRFVIFVGIVLLMYQCVTCIFARFQDVSYETALYWATATMTTTGYGDVVTTESWRPLSIVAMLLGLMGVSGTTAVVTTYFTTEDILSAERKEKKSRLRSMMKHFNIPWKVQKRTISVFQSALDNEHKAAFMKFVQNLPPDVSRELTRHVHAKILQTVPLFRSLPNGFDTILELAAELEVKYVKPHTFIINQGDFGEEMYFIVHGVVEVLIAVRQMNQVFVVERLDAGSWFGELELLTPQARKASVQSVTHCELLVLGSESFDRVVGQNAELRQRFIDDITLRYVVNDEFILDS